MYVVNPMCLGSGDIVNERYEIIRELGRGGFGITYTAYDNLRSPLLVVVLKQIPLHNSGKVRDTEYIKQLEIEANALKALKHPHIPNFFDSFTENDCYYIVQEHIKGHDLTKEIRPGEPINESKAISILQEILEILQFVHQQKIIHRDIKPANIIRRHLDNKLFLIDFGAVKEIATEHTNASGITLTRIIQSSGYTSAEQLAGCPRKNSDIYALGITILQAVTGFSINAICNYETIPLRDNKSNYIWQEYAPQISPKLKNVIAKMIAYDFRDRYQTVEEILQIIKSLNSSSWSNKNQPKSTRILKRLKYQKRKKIVFLPLAIITCCLLILLQNNPFIQKSICVNIGENISCGEEILNPLSEGSIRFRAAQEFAQKEYKEAANDYQLSWQQERGDAETLIYLNNSLLETSNLEYYTIAVAVPLSFDEKASIKNFRLAQSFLRGVAQAQTAINLNLAEENSIFDNLPGQGILKPKKISNSSVKGLKVIIVDDGNQVEQAQQTAKALAKMPNLLGVLGNYASEMTLATVDIYDKNNLAQISFGTTTKRLSNNNKYRRNFFRVVYTNREEAQAVVDYIKSIDVELKKVAAFYNPKSDYSNYFWIEVRNLLKKEKIPIYKAFNIADKNFNTKLALKEAKKQEVNIYTLLPDGQVTNSLSKAIEIIELDGGNSFIIGGNPIANPKVTAINIPQPINLVISTFWHPLSPQNLEFRQQSKQLWDVEIDGGTAMGYDAALTLIEAIKLQTKPTRKETIKTLANSEFIIQQGATGSIQFNTPDNGDRKDFYPTLIRLFKCQDKNSFVPLSIDNIQAENLVCNTKKEI